MDWSDDNIIFFGLGGPDDNITGVDGDFGGATCGGKEGGGIWRVSCSLSGAGVTVKDRGCNV